MGGEVITATTSTLCTRDLGRLEGSEAVGKVSGTSPT